MAQAVAPLAFGLLVDRWGAGALVVSGALSTAALLSLLLVRKQEAVRS